MLLRAFKMSISSMYAVIVALHLVWLRSCCFCSSAVYTASAKAAAANRHPMGAPLSVAKVRTSWSEGGDDIASTQ